MDGTYNWADTYVGPAANLDPAKSKWVITDETLDAAAYLALRGALTNIATANPTRRVSIELPKAKSIGHGAFTDRKALAALAAPVATSIEESAFNGCTNLESVTIPKAESIGNWAFRDCSSLTEVSAKATSIGDGAFKGCETLATVKLREAVSIEQNAFDGCKKLATVELPVAESIGNDAFKGCIALESIELTAAESIGTNAFRNCDRLATVKLPAATSIGENAFYGCTSLTSLTFDTPITTWGMQVLGNDNTIASDITLTLAAGQKAMAWDGNTNTFLPTANNFTNFGASKVFCGPTDVSNYTFAEIKKITN